MVRAGNSGYATVTVVIGSIPTFAQTEPHLWRIRFGCSCHMPPVKRPDHKLTTYGFGVFRPTRGWNEIRRATDDEDEPN